MCPPYCHVECLKYLEEEPSRGDWDQLKLWEWGLLWYLWLCNEERVQIKAPSVSPHSIHSHVMVQHDNPSPALCLGCSPSRTTSYPIPIFVSFIRCGIPLSQWKYTMSLGFYWEFRRQIMNPIIISEPPTISNHCADDPWLEGEPVNHSTITCHPEWQVSELLSFIHHVILSTQP